MGRAYSNAPNSWGVRIRDWVVKKTKKADLPDILFSICYKGIVRLTRKVLLEYVHFDNYSPAAIIRNAKIGNIILLLAFFRTLSSNLDLEYPAVSEENCLKNLLPLP